MMSKQIVFALLIGLAFSGEVVAQLTGEFVFVGTEAEVSGGSPAPFDVWEFRVTNRTGQGIFTFENMSFTGTFLQDSVSAQIGTTLALDPDDGLLPGVQRTADTFFTDDNATPTSPSGITDDAGALSSIAIGVLGQAWVADGATEAIAVFSVPSGTTLDATNFAGGGGTTGQTVTLITYAATLPTAVPIGTDAGLVGLGALLALTGGIAIQRRHGRTT